MSLGAIGAAVLLLGFVTANGLGELPSAAESTTPPASSGRAILTWMGFPPPPLASDVAACNDYAIWVAEREARLDASGATGSAHDLALDDDRYRPRLRSVGTVQGLAETVRDNPRAENAYRLCMVRRGYNVWG